MSKEVVSQNIEKIAQALGFLFSLNKKSKMNRVKLIKLLWAADRIHIRKYGRTITRLNDYYALKHGPVCSLALDIAQLNGDVLSKADIDYLQEYFEADKINTTIKKDVGRNHLSESDECALTDAWNKFKDEEPFDLADNISHMYPEWSKFEEHFKNRSDRIRIDEEDFFKNPEKDKYFQEDANTLDSAHEIYLETKEASKELANIFGVY